MTARKTVSSRAWRIAAATLLLGFAATASAEQLEGDALVPALRQGGYVIIMRHSQLTVHAARQSHRESRQHQPRTATG